MAKGLSLHLGLNAVDPTVRSYRANRDLYDPILQGVDREGRGKVKASVGAANPEFEAQIPFTIG